MQVIVGRKTILLINSPQPSAESVQIDRYAIVGEDIAVRLNAAIAVQLFRKQLAKAVKGQQRQHHRSAAVVFGGTFNDALTAYSTSETLDPKLETSVKAVLAQRAKFASAQTSCHRQQVKYPISGRLLQDTPQQLIHLMLAWNALLFLLHMRLCNSMGRVVEQNVVSFSILQHC